MFSVLFLTLIPIALIDFTDDKVTPSYSAKILADMNLSLSLPKKIKGSLEGNIEMKDKSETRFQVKGEFNFAGKELIVSYDFKDIDRKSTL